MAETYISLVEYLRRTAIVEVTEQGTYLEGEVPEDYTGAILRAQVVYEVIFSKPSGEVVQELYNPPKPLNKEGQPAEGKTVDGETLEEGDSPVELTTTFNTSLDKDLLRRIDTVFAIQELVGKGDGTVS